MILLRTPPPVRRAAFFFAAACVLWCVAAAPAAEDETARWRELTLEAGPIWNNDHAQTRCPEVLAEWLAAHPGEEARWTGEWVTTKQGEMSVCHCERLVAEEPAGQDEEREVSASGGGTFGEKNLAVTLENLTGLELTRVEFTMKKIAGDAHGGFYAQVLPWKRATFNLGRAMALDALVLDMGLETFVFDDLSALAGRHAATLVVGVSEDLSTPFANVADDDGNATETFILGSRIDYLAGPTAEPVPLSALIDAESVAVLRDSAAPVAEKGGTLVYPVDFAGATWLGLATPGEPASIFTDYSEDGATIAEVALRTRYDDATLANALATLAARGLRLWFLRVQDGADLTRDLKTTLTTRLPDDAPDVDAPGGMEMLREAFASTEAETGGPPFQITAILVTDATYAQAQTGTVVLDPQPGAIIRRTNSPMLEIRYRRDCTPFVDMVRHGNN